MTQALGQATAKLPLQTIGVLADTHIPDRVRALHPLLVPAFQAAKVSHIIHAGDISMNRVLDSLREIAPVTAVRGNRDVVVSGVPMIATVVVGGVTVAVMHGHGGLRKYLLDKVKFYLHGYNLHRYLDMLTSAVPAAQVVIFGHTHHAEIMHYRGKLLFNPGSACFGFYRSYPPTAGLIHIYECRRVKAEIIMLEGYRIRGGRWVRYKDEAEHFTLKG